MERYTFCNYREDCRWADATNEDIKGYELFPQVSLLRYNVPGRIQGGYASQRIQDYPEGKGLAFGWKPAQRVNKVALCTGVIQTDATINGRKIYGLGEEICSVCNLYERFHEKGGSSRERALNQCQENPKQEVNPWCGICPGDAGWFHHPLDAESFESYHLSDLESVAKWTGAAAMLPIIHLLILHMLAPILRISLSDLDRDALSLKTR